MRLPPPRVILDEVAPLFAGVEAQMGFVPNSLRAMAHKPELLVAFMSLARAAMAPSPDAPAELKQMVAYVASLAAGCRYCQAHTAHQAHRLSVGGEKLAALWTFEESPLFSDAERAALRLAMLAAQTPNAAEDADVAAVRAACGDRGLVEIMAVIALFGFLNRWNDTLATPLEDAPLAFAGDALPDWQAGKHAPEVAG